MAAEEEEFDLYDVLNLHRGASSDDVKASFRELSRLYHPDKQAGGATPGVAASPPAVAASGSLSVGSGGTSGAEAAFMRVHRAYRVLGDEALRAFYDRYGLAGVRLAESLSDDEEEEPSKEAQRAGDGAAESRSAKDRTRRLEQRVRALMRKREETRMQRLLAVSGTFTLSAAAAPPGPHGAHLRRRYRLQYSATSHSVQLAVNEKLNVTVGCVSHVAGYNGVGMGKFILAAVLQLGAATLRAGLSLMGGNPELDVSMARPVNDHLSVIQKVSLSGEGRSLSITALPFLSQTMRGNVAVSYGESGGNCSIGLIKRSSTSGHCCRASLNMQPGGGEVGTQLKYKPSRDFSLKIAPSISHRGWTLWITCTKVMDSERLTKLNWAIRIKRRNILVRFGVRRSGYRVSLPFEIWPEAFGPLPPRELALVAALWVLPPFALRLLNLAWRHCQYLQLQHCVGREPPPEPQCSPHGREDCPATGSVADPVVTAAPGEP